MNYTTNYSMKKPASTDRFLVSDLNENFDTLDGLFGGIRIAAPLTQSQYDGMQSHDPGTLYLVKPDAEEE
jgi:hypothetical protein